MKEPATLRERFRTSYGTFINQKEGYSAPFRA
jgi:hypothetical protein